MRAVALLQLVFLVGVALCDETDLQHFDRNQLSENFRAYRVTPCTEEVNTCLQALHTGAQRCAGMWKRQAGPRYEHCVTNDPQIQNCTRDWQEASFKWHKAMDNCLQGAPAPAAETLQNLDADAAMFAFSEKRRKRDANNDHVACWREMRQQKDQCKQKAYQCTQFAHCYGEHSEPSDASAKRWYNYVKKLREDARKKSRIHIMHMGHCLRGEPHTSGHGGHEGHGGHGGGDVMP